MKACLSVFCAAIATATCFVSPLLAATHHASWVDQRAAEFQPTAQEKRFDEIAWAPDIRSALQLAKNHQRPVFLFTHDGRMNTGRC